MTTAITCDKFGFFNGLYGIEQSNWANFWRGIIPDGIIAYQGDEMEVYASADGMQVHVKTGQAMVDNHRVWLTSAKTVTVAASDNTNNRIDLVVLRVVYANSKQSKAYVDIKTGTPAADPQPPSLIQVTGETYEIPLAEVLVAAGVVTIASSAVTDLRYIFRWPNDTVETFSTTEITPLPDREYRNGTAISALTVNLPDHPHETYISAVNFTASNAFAGVTVKKGTATISGTSDLKVKGDALTLTDKRYNLTFYWDGSYYWVASAAV